MANSTDCQPCLESTYFGNLLLLLCWFCRTAYYLLFASLVQLLHFSVLLPVFTITITPWEVVLAGIWRTSLSANQKSLIEQIITPIFRFWFRWNKLIMVDRSREGGFLNAGIFLHQLASATYLQQQRRRITVNQKINLID